jgi:glutaredoxin
MANKKINKSGKLKLVMAIIAIAAAAALSFFFITKGAHGGKDKLIEVVLLHSPTCPHCKKAMAFLDKIEPKYPEVEFSRYNVETTSGGNYYLHYRRKLKWDSTGIPVAVFGDKYVLGFGSDETTGREYTGLIDGMLEAKRAEIKAGKK